MACGEVPALHLSCYLSCSLPRSVCRGHAMWRGEASGHQLSSLPGLPALPLTSCGTADTFLNLSESQFIYPTNGDANIRVLGLNEIGQFRACRECDRLGAPRQGFGLNMQKDPRRLLLPSCPKATTSVRPPALTNRPP